MDDAALRSARDVRDGAYWMAITVALTTGAVAVICALVLGLPIRDPDGFLGPTYVRLPLIAALMLAVDVVPRALYRTRSLRGVPRSVVDVLRERWPWRRLRPPLIGLGAFYLTYVSYRNLKNYLPLLRPELVDRELLELDERMAGGRAPAQILHELLGTGATAYVLSWVYLAFLIFVPASLGFVLLSAGRSRQASWYVTALCLNWALGTASYYLLPSMGPIYAQPSLFWGLPETGTSDLQESLLVSRWFVLADPQGTERIQSIAAFASLHVSIVFTAALIAHMVLRSVAIRAVMWIFFALTVTSTIYFGWHYIVDDIAGLAIGGFSVLLAGWGTGQFGAAAARAAARAPVDERVHQGGTEPATRLRRRLRATPTST